MSSCGVFTFLFSQIDAKMKIIEGKMELIINLKIDQENWSKLVADTDLFEPVDSRDGFIKNLLYSWKNTPRFK